MMTTSVERSFGIQPPSNPEVLGIHIVAFERANATKTHPGEPHLVEALLRIGSVSDSLAAIGVDVAQAKKNVACVVEALPRRPGLFTRVREVVRNTRAVIDPLHRARAQALASGLDELTGTFAFAVLADSENADLVAALTSAGYSHAKYRWQLAHRDARDATCPASGPVRVVVYDDPFTPMDFVVAILTEVFARDAETARALMLRVHAEGSAPLAIMDAEAAARGVAEARARADKREFPLRFGVTSADP